MPMPCTTPLIRQRCQRNVGQLWFGACVQWKTYYYHFGIWFNWLHNGQSIGSK